MIVAERWHHRRRSLKKFSSEALARIKNYVHSAFSGLEVALLASFVLLLANALFFEPATGFKTKLLPNVDIDQRELTRLYAAALGVFLSIRLFMASKRFDKGSTLFWTTFIVSTIAANVAVVVLATSSIFAFTTLLLPLLLLVSLELWFLWGNRPIGFFQALLPSVYVISAVLWFLNVLFAEHSFRIESPLPKGSLELVESEIEELLVGRDPCIQPSADIVLTPFGYWTFFRTKYDTTCGADSLVRDLGVDAVTNLLLVNEWMGSTSVSQEGIGLPQLLTRQRDVILRLAERGEVVLETAQGRIILQTLENAVVVEPVMEEAPATQNKAVD